MQEVRRLFEGIIKLYELLDLISSATTGRTGGMRKAPKRGHIEQSLVFIVGINPPEAGK